MRLEDAKASDWTVPPCEADVNPADRIGFSILFSLPRTMKSSPYDTDDLRSYFVFPRGSDSSNAEFFISTSIDRTVETANVIDSDWAEQRWIKEGAGTEIGIDARGRLKDGSHWRIATFRGHDTASYNLRSGEKTELLDAVIDAACIAK